jgi:hypothetical protein
MTMTIRCNQTVDRGIGRVYRLAGRLVAPSPSSCMQTVAMGSHAAATRSEEVYACTSRRVGVYLCGM